MASSEEIRAVFNLLTTNYGYIQREKTPQEMASLLDLWIQLLADLDGDTLRVATLKHVSESKWFPSIAELREQAASILCPNSKTAIEAWGDVVRAFHNFGQYQTPKFDDEITAEVVRDLGWVELCNSEMPEADRARFIQGYEAMTKRRKTESVALPQVQQYIAQIAEARSIPRLEAKR